MSSILGPATRLAVKALSGAILLLAAARTAPAQQLTLRAAVDEALTRNPAIAAAGAGQQAAAARQAEARAARLPRVDISETATRGNNPVFVFGSLLEQGRFGMQHFDPGFLNAPDPLTNHRASLTARYSVFDGLRTSSNVRQARNGVDRAAIELDDVQQRLRAGVIARFYGVVVAGEKVAVAREAVRSAEADASATRDRFAQGLLVESEPLSADVQLALFRQRLIAADGDLAIARAALATLLQRPRGEAITIAATLPSVPSGETDLDAAIARATTNRVPVKIASMAMANAGLRLTAERGAALPRVDAFGTFGASGATFGDRNTDYTGAIAVTLEIFDRGRAARVAAARAEIDAARAGQAMARDAVAMETITAWHRLRVARETAAVANSAAEQAGAAARIVRDRYEQGLTTITEQLRAQTALVSARFDLLAARYESLIAHTELLRAMGDLDDVQTFL